MTRTTPSYELHPDSVSAAINAATGLSVPQRALDEADLSRCGGRLDLARPRVVENSELDEQAEVVSSILAEGPVPLTYN